MGFHATNNTGRRVPDFSRSAGLESSSGETPQHSPEHHYVHRAKKMPVEHPAEPSRLELCNLPNHCRRTGRLCAELQPSTPGDLHFRKQPKPPAWLVRFNTPEIQSASRKWSLRVGPASPHSYAAYYEIDQTTNPPQRITEIPAVSAADPANWGQTPERDRLASVQFATIPSMTIELRDSSP
jgi:hypothetical protein